MVASVAQNRLGPSARRLELFGELTEKGVVVLFLRFRHSLPRDSIECVGLRLGSDYGRDEPLCALLTGNLRGRIPQAADLLATECGILVHGLRDLLEFVLEVKLGPVADRDAAKLYLPGRKLSYHAQPRDTQTVLNYEGVGGLAAFLMSE